MFSTISILAFPGGSVVKNQSPCEFRSHRFDPWVGKIPWRRKWQLTSVFLPGKSHGKRGLVDYSSWKSQRVRQDLVNKQQQQQRYICTILYAIQEVLISYLFVYQFSSVAQSCPTLCDPMNHSMPGLPVHHQLPEFTETHVH